VIVFPFVPSDRAYRDGRPTATVTLTDIFVERSRDPTMGHQKGES
jgi:hypothetical protein